ncbi:NlpC/P60 family protein [Candidatus Fukatsuia endosymbiont of Tuberolachnus salignus]|uniref:NlpC/P60 family protein n=1 Tax=Candidatus Fukatsuia endosymbiont of Tuberolachnus salignus TaxID=3077957 RepID=UPI00313BC87A
MIKPQIVMKYGLRTIILITVVAILSACSSPKLQKRQTAQSRLSFYSSQSEFETGVRNVQIKAKILKQYAGWKAVRYRFGGSSKKGVDCSAFVQLTFREQFGIASASIGVTISSLNDQYWHKRYYAGRRVLNSHRRS